MPLRGCFERGRGKWELEYLYEHPNRLSRVGSSHHEADRKAVSEAAVRLLEEMGHTPETSAAVAWQRRKEDTLKSYVQGVLGDGEEPGDAPEGVIGFGPDGRPL